ncbi:UDP-2,4-diacetamido-2,4,6-trideoxy-beta-L-altropyranose hydrolase [Thauera mechernichensis]|uniref:UDP-2,4-diacetamido-2,4, 6-trideoxy-beta-L-altropyranose hydrolase n=1 Tax=Thauera mechernichensis TaxID=82788 RepID=A0ABW3WAT3_9RHOO|nr:UDP-2,4-diacetamido-2,4,6-trideoxy-beta-L-altropyranose hydrolase [Thauera mechernichensis]MDG3065876.1 UDP-2,4-diacetamido-2,4,6-trideoxy-beta-L-altropyranose hydrolase [Thauera mechernichensis]
MKVAFRADASLQIGTGHVMRCLTLADALAAHGADCQFICRAHEGNLIEFIRGKGYVTHALPIVLKASTSSTGPGQEASPADLAHSHWLGATQAQDAEACAPILVAHRPDWLIADHYALDARWERALAPHYRKLMVIDDLADRPHACDLLLDQTFGRDAADYRPLVPADCRLLCGSQYALLRPEFAALRPYSLQRRARPALHELLITMGGVDKDNATGQVLQALRTCPLPADCRITVVMGATAPWLEEVRTQAQDMPRPTRVLVGVNDMAQLMADSDLAIGAAGSTSWELCCLGVPNLLVCTAANQRTVIGALASVNATAKLDRAELSRPDGIPFCVQYTVLTKNLGAYAADAARITDGSGASRVCAELA